jgi:hypothetical protein
MKPRKKCPHNRQRSRCKDCGGSGICKHHRRRSTCKHCGGSSVCEHGRQRSTCKDCGGSRICEHNRERSTCKDCGGSKICEHRHRRSTCRECGGSEICEHHRERYRCSDCHPKGAFGHCRYQATKVRGLVFELTLEEFKTVVSWPCLYCGEDKEPRGIDRWDNAIGYVMYNCIPCCSMCNYIKNDYSGAEFIDRCRRIIEYTILSEQENDSGNHI